jgi:hypothetical protein
MTDLVKWLRGWPAEVEEFGQCADEIERLRQLLREYVEFWDFDDHEPEEFDRFHDEWTARARDASATSVRQSDDMTT